MRFLHICHKRNLGIRNLMRANVKCPEVEMLSEAAAKVDLSPEALCKLPMVYLEAMSVLVRSRELFW